MLRNRRCERIYYAIFVRWTMEFLTRGYKIIYVFFKENFAILSFYSNSKVINYYIIDIFANFKLTGILFSKIMPNFL